MSHAQLPAHSDNADEELSRVQLALNAVFSTDSTQSSQEWWSQRQLADRYLISFQSRPISWMVCDKLLHDESSDVQKRFFAAQTLHTKCRTDIHQLPVESLPSLRDSLLQHLQKHAQGDALTTRLALCVSAFAVQMNWCTIVSDLLSNPTPLALTILQVLPEECASRRLYVDDVYRYAMRDHLVATSSTFFQFLQTQEPTHVLQILHTWIHYVPIRPDTLAETALLAASVQALTQAELMEAAADVVVEVLRMYPSHQHGNEALVQAMLPLLFQLPLDEALASADEDVQRAYCRVITEMGESYMSLILSEQPVSNMVDGVLKCSQVADQEVSSITLNFWYRLVIDLEAIHPFEWRQELIDIYTPHMLQLIDVCVNHLMKFPDDIDELADDLVEDINRHRFYVAETVEDCCRLLGGHSVLQKIGTALRQQVQQNLQQWQGIESSLACICAIHRFVPSDENEFLPFIFEMMSHLPMNIRPLRYTSNKIIGKFASWLAAHPELTKPLLPFLAQSLSDKECAPAAAVAIKELCGCSNQRFAIIEPVLQLYSDVAGHLQLADELQVLEGACTAVSREIFDTRTHDISPYVARLTQPILMRLGAAVADQHASPRRNMIPEIDRLTVVVQFLKVASCTPNPMLEMMKSLWSLLEAVFNRFPDDNMLAEKLCRLHKHALRSIGSNAYSPMANTLLQTIVLSYERSRQSPFLYLASICVAEYGQNPVYTQQLFDTVFTLSNTTFSFLRDLEDMTNHPDVVEEFFYLMGRVTNNCPDPLMISPLLHSLLQCAVVGMQLEHQGANKGTLRFLDDLISYALSLREQNKPESKAALEKALSREGQMIVHNLARAVIGDLPAYNERQIPETLWKLNLFDSQLLLQWLASAFQGVERIPERPKAEFMSALSKGLPFEEFSIVVRAFQDACGKERRSWT
ncbi:transportin-3 [Fistulifera solaris]|uniref:Transportin-3 n=1 Tax=Fistulifera solaris TaxID=1519565 RepID=A0A1Z5K957_FISSO|nr:transportin-3 [Fistulifera solaris]|eukprot:GAX22810.1 transportin-3 [Fistulifera solaris]